MALDAPEQRRHLKSVGVLWLLVVAVFAGFNAFYWPVRSIQIRNAPENFLAHARELYAQDARGKAIARLSEGILTFRPVCPEPYQMLAEWQAESGEMIIPHAGPAAHFYQALQYEGNERHAMLKRALEMHQAYAPQASLLPDTAKHVQMLAGSLGVLWGIEQTLRSLPAEQQVALLMLSGANAIDFSGMIGQTGAASPVDILVQSGGGRAGRHCTHILLRNQDYAGARRGFYAVLIDPQSGQVAQMGAFDVWQSEEEAARMDAFLRNAPLGMIAAFAVADEASINLSAALEEALCAFGLHPRTFFNRQPVLFGAHFSFAAIGVKGAAQGSAIQTWSPGEFGGCAGHAVTCGVVRLLEDAP